MTRRAYTLVESMVAVALAGLIIGAVWNSLHLVTVGDRVADREAARALEEARAMELLLRDLRSASGPVNTENGPGEGELSYQFRRWVRGRAEDRLKEVGVTWKLQTGQRITRIVEGESPMNFHFDPRMEKTGRPFKLRIEKVSKVDWQKEVPVAPPR